MSPDYQYVTLIKTDDTFGHLNLGARQTTRHPATIPPQDAIINALRRLKRSCPDENPTCWTPQTQQEQEPRRP
jgi:hypothetical protein